MAVAFMASLEKSPETYDKAFDEILEGRSSRIRERVLSFVSSGMRVLDLGCGPGLFSTEAARKGAYVIGVDSDIGMIERAKERSGGLENTPNFIHADVLAFSEGLCSDRGEMASSISSGERFNLIVSTFLLSEIEPVERDFLLRLVRDLLADDGMIVIAAESLPESASDRKTFWKNREHAEQKAGKRLPPPIASLEMLVQQAGLIIDECENYGPEITYLVGKKSSSRPQNEYQSRTKSFFGIYARTRIWFDHLTGGWRGIPIKPGLYRAGSPTPESSVLVTANYELTYYTVMRTLARDQIDAWVLVCDTAGINVWCAARGVHFDSDDIVQMIKLTGLSELVGHRELILPQLAAAGIDTSDIRRRTGFGVKYGPVRIYDLSEWLKLGKPRPKPRRMATVTFNLRERMEQTVAHVPFLFAVLLGKPIAAILGLIALINMFAFIFQPAFTAVYPISLQVLLFMGEFTFALAANSLVLGLLFPALPSKGNSFLRRGFGLAVITLPLAVLIMILLGTHWTTLVMWTAIQFILAISLTMDWSGMTSVSDPKVIRREYPYLILELKVGLVFLIIFNIVVVLMGW